MQFIFENIYNTLSLWRGNLSLVCWLDLTHRWYVVEPLCWINKGSESEIAGASFIKRTVLSFSYAARMYKLKVEISNISGQRFVNNELMWLIALFGCFMLYLAWLSTCLVCMVCLVFRYCVEMVNLVRVSSSSIELVNIVGPSRCHLTEIIF